MGSRKNALERFRADPKLQEIYAQLLSGTLTIAGLHKRLDAIEQRIQALKQQGK